MKPHAFVDHCLDDDCPIWDCRVCYKPQSDPCHNQEATHG
jgi:hypothetical protein